MLDSDRLSVAVDTGFPRVIEYRWKDGGAALKGDTGAVSEIEINGARFTPRTTSSRSGSILSYTLRVEELGATIGVDLEVKGNVLHLRVPRIEETGTNLVRTLSIPDSALLTLSAADRGATVIASQVPKPDVVVTVAQAAADAKRAGYTHVVAHTEKLAASVWNNVLLDSGRIAVQTQTNTGATVTRVWCPGWTWREIDAETVEAPEARVVVTADANGDGVVDWQDGAIAYRAIEPRPQGAERTPWRVVSQIAMNFASQAQHPFLSVLDSVKKVYLWTDGLGQDIQFKGYQTEGHDSSHPDYGGSVGRRQGGRDELDFVMARMRDFNARPGVHINATEYYPEARHYSLDLVNTNKKGWAWLDQSYYTDQRYDIVSGKLYARLDEMKADLPNLDWVYVDVYFGTGWNARKLAQKLNACGWTVYTEFPGLFERDVTWCHTSQDWTQRIWGDGRKSRLARFIQNEFKDVWPHDPLVRGSNDDGFLGWHGQRDVLAVIRSAFVVNLPSKYLQHFPMMRWTDALADFGGGVRAVAEEGAYRIYRGDRLLNSARYPQSNQPPVDCEVFLPWDPVLEAKIYHWSDAGGPGTWALPESWKGLAQVRLYRLTDTGRVFEREVPVRDGRVALESAPATPYVLYKEEPPPYPEIVWGERGFVKDPGFDSHSFGWWRPSAPGAGADHVKAVNDARGQAHLLVQGGGGAAAEVSQVIHGLQPGRWYAAGVWIELEGERTASIAVRPWAGHASAWREADKKGWTIVSASSEETAAEKTPAVNAIDGDPATMWHSQYAGKADPHPHELVIDLGAATDIAGFSYLPRQAGSNGTVDRYAFLVSPDGAAWSPAARGRFAAAPKGQASQAVLPSPVRARFVKFVAEAEAGGQDFTSAAEIGVLRPPERKPGAFEPVERVVRRSNVKNFQDNHDKYLTHFQRAKVVFQAPAEGRPVELVLRAASGAPDAAARFDDARIVETVKPDRRGHDFYEDFENVDQYWGPFVYGFQGNTRVHLSEAHPPFTDDVVDGTYSLKSMEDTAALLYRSTPALLPLAPGTTYKLAFDYLCDSNNQHRVVVRSDSGGPEALDRPLPGEGRQRRSFEATFTTGPQDDYWLGVIKAEKGPGILSIDNVALDVVNGREGRPPAVQGRAEPVPPGTKATGE